MMSSTTGAAASQGFLARCVSSVQGNESVERIRERGSEAVTAFYRLVKIGLIHSAENDAVSQLLEQTLVVLREFSGLAGGPVIVTFVDGTVFVCGQLLRASRSVFESAAELGDLLAKCGVSEVRFDPALTREDLRAAGQAVSAALRDEAAPRPSDLSIATVTFLKNDSLVSRKKGKGITGEKKALGYYASALILMRRFFDDVAAGNTLLPARVKRIAQGLVGLAETEGPGLLGLTALANAHRDDAGRALQSAILGIVIAREITRERVAVGRIAMAALLADVGRVRLAGKEGRDRLVRLPVQVEREVPSMTGAVSLAISGVTAQNALHTVIVTEATALEREMELGPVYKGKLQPLLHSKILQVTRAALDFLAPRDNTRGLSIMDALAEMAKNPSLDRVVMKMLVKAVGLVPIGSVVELASGEWAVVAGPSRNLRSHDRPVVRVVIDKKGAVVDPPLEWDLGSPPDGAPYPQITRILSREETRFNVAGALV